MYFLSRTAIKRWGIVIGLIPLLSACAYAPGMRMDKQNVSQTLSDQDREQASQSAAPGVTPVLKSITPQLLQAEKITREQQASQDISQLVATPMPYLIGSGDVLSIVVWDHPELSTPAMTSATTISAAGATDVGATNTPGFVVDQDGLVQFPYAGPLKLAGLTEAQARTLLTRQLKNYLKKPDLTLRVRPIVANVSISMAKSKRRAFRVLMICR